MKSNKKFPPAPGAIVEQALKDNTAWVGKTVLELTCEAIKKRSLSKEDEGCVVLTLDEAKKIERKLYAIRRNHDRKGEDNGVRSVNKLLSVLNERITQAEGK